MSVTGSPALDALCARAWQELMLRQMREVGAEPAEPPIGGTETGRWDGRVIEYENTPRVGLERIVGRRRRRPAALAPDRSGHVDSPGYVPSWAKPLK